MVAIAYQSPARAEQKQATRQALKAAATKLFSRHGFAATQVGQITREAGVAKGTFYVHFSDKEALLDEMLHEFNDGFVAHVHPLFEQGAGGGDLHGLVTRLAGLFLGYWEDHRDFIRVYAEKAAGNMSLDALQFGINPQIQAVLRHTLADATRSGKPEPEIDLIIQGILSLWLRLGLQYLFNPAATREAVTRTLVAMTTGALAGALSS